MARRHRDDAPPWQAPVVSFVSLVFACVIWISVDPNEGAPPRASLEGARGVVSSSRADRRALHFTLPGVDRPLKYFKTSGLLGRVAHEIEHAGERQVRVLFERNRREPSFWTGDGEHAVYEIEIEGRGIRRWEDVDEALRSNSAVAPWVGLAFALAGAWGARDWLTRRDVLLEPRTAFERERALHPEPRG